MKNKYLVIYASEDVPPQKAKRDGKPLLRLPEMERRLLHGMWSYVVVVAVVVCQTTGRSSILLMTATILFPFSIKVYYKWL